MRIRFLFLWLTCFCLIQKLNAQDNVTDKREHFIAICKAVASMEIIQSKEYFYKYQGKQTLFFKSELEYMHNPDERVIVPLNEHVHLGLWFKKDLFFHNIPYWFAVTELIEENDTTKVGIRLYNSVNYEEERQVIQGVVHLRFYKGKFEVIGDALTLEKR